MSYIKRIEEISKDFPGVFERASVLNAQFSQLSENGLDKLVHNFLSNKGEYTLRPFLFEVFLARWLRSRRSITDLQYEPDGFRTPPDFSFRIDNSLFYVQAKVLVQIGNEQTKKKIVHQINSRISGLTNNVLEIWLSEDIDAKMLNSVVDWVTKKATRLSIGEKEAYSHDGEAVAWVKVLCLSNAEGYVGIEHIGESHDGLICPTNIEAIRNRVRDKIKRANRNLPDPDNNTFNLLALTNDFSMLLSLESIQDALYGTEEIIGGCDERGDPVFYERLTQNGIWSKRVFTNIDLVLYYDSGVDLLGDTPDPCLFVNPFNSERIRTITEPFYSMKARIPHLYYEPRRLDM
jgi:hypothetical protein